MPAREISCQITEIKLLTPTVMGVSFEPSRKFAFEPGQFLSLVVPRPFAPPGSPKRLRRIYSLASAPEQGYQLSVKQTHGPGPTYLASLRPGDEFKASAPYGHFLYEPRAGRSVCFISTGTGVAPFRAMMQSRLFRENPPERAFNLFGARTEDELLYTGEFENYGVENIYALSKPGPDWKGFKGRVTDYLSQLPSDWAWHSTDFYLCGNGDMVAEVKRILRNSHGVAESAIHQEVYFGAQRIIQPPGAEPAAKESPAA